MSWETLNANTCLRKAADHIERYGHIKGEAYADNDHPETSAACVLGALNLFPNMEARRQLRRYLGNIPSLAWWNDREETTKEDVVNALRGAADANE